MDLKKVLKDAIGGSDKNTVTIGEGAQVEQIAVGRNILQAKINIGSLVVPVRFLLALLVVALVLAVAVWWITTPGQMPAGNSNVVIVEFGAQNAAGNVTSSSQGTYLSQWLYNRLSESLQDLPPDARPTFWHIATGFDPLHLFQKRLITQPIKNDADAERVAKQFNARIVIYGNLVQGQSTESFVPEFYVQATQGEADELAGSQQLGQPIPISQNVNDEYLEQTLQPIGRALIWFSRGLNNDLNGRYDLAYQVFKQGEAQLTDWNQDQGKEVLYYFIGREALFLGNCESDAKLQFTPQGATTATELALNTAAENFSTAQKIAVRNGRTYARATFGLGQVQLQRAQRVIVPPSSTTVGQCHINLPPSGTPVSCPARTAPVTDAASIQKASDLAAQALAFFMQAQKEMPDPAPSGLAAKNGLVTAIGHYFQGELELFGGNAVDAKSLTEQAAKELQELIQTTPRDDQRTLTEEYLALGTSNLYAAFARLNLRDQAGARVALQSAIQAYTTCTKMIPSDELDAFLRGNVLPNCSCTLTDTQNALNGLK